MKQIFTNFITRIAGITLLCILSATTLWGQNWSHNFVSGESILNNSITVEGVTWTVSTTAGEGNPTISYGNSNQEYGLKFGSSKSNYYGSVTFSTDYFNSYNVQSVSVKVLNNGSKNGTLTVKQGNTTLGTESATFGQTWTDLTANSTAGSGGALSFTYSVAQAFYIHSITVVYSSGGSAPSLEESDFTLTDAPISLSFDLYNNKAAQTVNYTTSSTGVVTVSASDCIETTVDQTNKTITVTPVAKTTSSQTITVSQAADDSYKAGSTTFTVSITDSTPYEQPTTIEITPNYAFWGKTAQFSGDTNDSLSGSKDNVSLVWSRGSGSTYANTSAMRFYKDNEIEFSAPEGYHIKSIVITGTLNNDEIFYPARFDTESSTWSGSSEKVTMSRPSSAASYSSISKYTITVGSPAETCSIPVFSLDAGTYTSAQNVTITSSTEGVTIYYTTDGTTPTVNSSVYSSEITVSETMTIKAIAVKDGYVNSEVASVTYSIILFDHAGTQADPYSVSDALKAIAADSGKENVYIVGVVSRFYKTSITGDGTNYRYYISDAGNTDELLVFKGKGLNNVAFSDDNDLLVGDEVTILGSLTTYNSTPEINSGNYIVSLNRPVIPSISLDATVINAPAAENGGSIAVTYNNIATVASDVAFYESDGTTVATYDWITASVNQSNNVEYLIDENSSTSERFAYMKVWAYDNEMNEVYSDLITFNQKGFVADYAILPFEYDGNGTGSIPAGLSVSGLGTYSSSPAMKFDGTGDYAILKIGEAPGTLSFDIKGNSFSGGTFKVQTSTNGENYTDLKSYTELGTTQNEVLSIASDVRYIKWIYTEKSSGNVALGNIKLAKPAADSYTINGGLSNGQYWASFYCKASGYTISDGAKAFTMNASNKLYLLGEGNVIPANTAVIIISDVETITLTKADNASATVSGGANILVGVDSDTAVSGISGTPYVLSIVNDTLGFYKYTGSNIPANKAYYIVNE